MTVYQIASDEDIERVFGAAVNGKKDGVLQSPSHLLSLLSEVGLPLSLRAAHTFFDKYDVVCVLLHFLCAFILFEHLRLRRESQFSN